MIEVLENIYRLKTIYQFEYPPSTNRDLHINENHIIAINVQNYSHKIEVWRNTQEQRDIRKHMTAIDVQNNFH